MSRENKSATAERTDKMSKIPLPGTLKRSSSAVVTSPSNLKNSSLTAFKENPASPPLRRSSMVKASSERTPKAPDISSLSLTPEQEKKLKMVKSSSIRIALTDPTINQEPSSRSRSKSVGTSNISEGLDPDDDDDNASKSSRLATRDRIVLSKGYVPTSPRRSITIFIENDDQPSTPKLSKSESRRLAFAAEKARAVDEAKKKAEENRKEAERLEKEKAELELKEQQRIERERLELERLEQERLERERLERLKREEEERERNESILMNDEENYMKDFLHQEHLEFMRLEDERKRREAARLEEQKLVEAIRLEEERRRVERERQLQLERELARTMAGEEERRRIEEETKEKLEAWRIAQSKAKADARRNSIQGKPWY